MEKTYKEVPITDLDYGTLKTDKEYFVLKTIQGYPLKAFAIFNGSKFDSALITHVLIEQPPSLPLRELRDRFFKECTDSDIKVNIAPHDLFEWFMRNVPKPSSITADADEIKSRLKPNGDEDYLAMSYNNGFIECYNWLKHREEEMDHNKAIRGAFLISEQVKPTIEGVNEIIEIEKEAIMNMEQSQDEVLLRECLEVIIKLRPNNAGLGVLQHKLKMRLNKR